MHDQLLNQFKEFQFLKTLGANILFALLFFASPFFDSPVAIAQTNAQSEDQSKAHTKDKTKINQMNKSVGEPHWDDIRSTAIQENLANDRQWLRLGNYHCGYLGCKSEEDGQNFMLSPQGHSDPEAELIATIEMFEQNPVRELGGRLKPESVRCQFPARLTWLARKTGDWDADLLLRDCEGYTKFQKNLNAEGVSLVFSSFYLNNPSSAFGHTFIKVKGRKSKENPVQSDLLNYGIGYGANPTTSNPILYSLMGLFGGFYGAYVSLPYYYKVREYNDYENRDLWEYELNLEPSEVDMIVKHIWELGHGDFRYLYLSENCSYKLLEIIDAAAPRYNLVAPLPYWVIPIDTVKSVIQEPHLVRKITYRPSLATTLESRYKILSTKEKDDFHKTILNYDAPKSISANTLDAVIDYFDVTHSEMLIEKNIESQNTKHKLLVLRSRMAEPPETFAVNIESGPHNSHESLKLELAAGQRDTTIENTQTYHFGVKFSLHDLVDPTLGLPPYARIEMMSGQFFFEKEDKEFHVDRLRFVGIEALNTWNQLWQKPIWRFDLGGERIFDQRCVDCFASLVGGSIGVAREFQLLDESIRLTTYVYANGRGRTGRFTNDDLSYEVGPSIGLRLLTSIDFNILAEYERRSIWNPSRETINFTHIEAQKIFDKTWGLRSQYDRSDRWTQLRLGVIFYQ